MELRTSNIKKILIFLEIKPCTSGLGPQNFLIKKFVIFFPKKPCQKKFFYIFSRKPVIFRKWNPEKSSLYFRKWGFLALILKISYISRNGTLHFSAQARKMKKTYPEKISDASGNRNPEKNSDISQEKAFLIFQGTETKENSSCLRKRKPPKNSYISESNFQSLKYEKQ